jgi:hypothetical protein
MHLAMTESRAVDGFRPSVNGLHFGNRWEPGPTIRLGIIDPRWVGVGDAKNGLCGGMSWLVRERFGAGQPIPADATAPANGSPLFRAIVRRQILSLGWMRVPLQFWRAATMDPAGLARRTLADEWPRIRAEIDAGRLAMVGLIRHHSWNPMQLDRDHQVLAYGYETDGPGGPTTIRLYDPNWPDRDDVAIHLSTVGFRQSTGEPLLGVIALT